MSEAYTELQALLREAATLVSVANLLSWDQETMMPPRAAAFRADELAMITELAHRRAIDPRVGDLLSECESDAQLKADPTTSANLREIRRDYDRSLKLPPELVAEINGTSSRAVEAWKQARADNDFARFRPWLERQIDLHRQKADCYGWPKDGGPYDALVEDFEPGMTAAELERIFRPLRDELTPLIAAIAGAGHQPGTGPHAAVVPRDRQYAFNCLVLECIGFDMQGGRLDASVHPFSSGVAPGDTRITTRYQDDQFPEALSSTLHEAGHGLYEQGLPKEERLGQPLAEAMGLGIHESQSRMWENHVGRSRAFWRWALPKAKAALGPTFEPFTVDDLFGAVNRVSPNLIRVESDEATYNLHIMLRFDLERAMFRGDLAVADLPAAWNDRIRDDLGLEVPDDRRGCMQDIHWSMGSIGYFPTYTLGNLYAAQFWEAIRSDLPNLDAEIAEGEFSGLLGWLRERVHQRARSLRATELCVDLTGRPLSHEPLMRHLNGKFRAIYGI